MAAGRDISQVGKFNPSRQTREDEPAATLPSRKGLHYGQRLYRSGQVNGAKSHNDELTLVLNPEDSWLTWNRQEVDLAVGLGSRQFGEGRILIEAEDDRTVLGREHQQMDFGALGLP